MSLSGQIRLRRSFIHIMSQLNFGMVVKRFSSLMHLIISMLKSTIVPKISLLRLLLGQQSDQTSLQISDIKTVLDPKHYKSNCLFKLSSRNAAL
jgi:hypothetical protein